ncbi:MAG TPA: MDR family MFS transporter [Burkholderiales bacterium]|jgi:EmrB/QacA subfamily drug resistance transporter
MSSASDSRPVPAEADAAFSGEHVNVRDFLQLFSAVMLPMFLAAIDQTLLATATPSIAADLGDLRDSAWIAVGYLLASTVMVPLYGRLGDRYGRREMLLAALGGFMIGSLACGFAQSMGQLIGARVLQGLGGGGLMVMAQALIGELVPPRQRARFQGYFAAVFTFASVSGPVLGGLVVTHASWRWLFWVNVPLGLFAAWRLSLLTRGMRNDKAPGIEDVPGLLLFTTASVVSLLWVSQAGHRFDWTSPESLAFVAASAVLWAGLVWREHRTPGAFLPVELLRQPSIALMSLTIVCSACCMFSVIFFLPVYLQLGHGVSAQHAGLMVLPLTFGMVFGSTTTGRLISKFGKPKWIPVCGLSISCVGFLLMAFAPPIAGLISGLGFVCGMGVGTVMPTGQIVIQTRAGRSRLGIASATTSLARSTGASLGTALFGALVFALMGHQDLHDPAALTEAQREQVIHAFQHAYFAAALVAALGAWIGSRVQQTKL